MTDKYIRKQDAFDKIWTKADDFEQNYDILYAQGARAMAIVVEQIPPADVVQVRHGKWIKEWWHGERTRTCSICNITQSVNVYEDEVKFKYCPYCGAKMDGEE